MSEKNIEALEQEELEMSDDTQVNEASSSGAGKNKESMKKIDAPADADDKIDDAGTDPTKNDAKKPDYAKSVKKTSVMGESSSKMAIIKSIYDKLDEMSKEEVAEVLSALNEVDEEVSEQDIFDALISEGYTEEEISEMSDAEITRILNRVEVKQVKESKKVIDQEEFEGNLAEDVEALISGEELSEEFKEKAATIFEAAVFARVNEEIANRVEKLEEQYKQDLEEAIAENKSSMIEKVDDFMNYVVREWMEENQIAIEKGIRSEIVEDFMVGLKNLFVEHYIDIPDEKVDLVDDLFAKVEDLEESLNAEIQKNIQSAKELKEYKKLDALYTVSEGLTEVQAEKLQKLAEGVDYESEEQYGEKLQMIREKYFPNNEQQMLNEEIVEDDLETINEESEEEVVYGEATDTIRRYADAISRTLKK